MAGPFENDECWPVIFIAHPNVRKEKLPPETMDLFIWLNEKNLIDGELVVETAIVNGKTVHTKSESGGQYIILTITYVLISTNFTLVIVHTGG